MILPHYTPEIEQLKAVLSLDAHDMLLFLYAISALGMHEQKSICLKSNKGWQLIPSTILSSFHLTCDTSHLIEI